MPNQRPLETSGQFAGLSARTAKALSNGGYTNREQIRIDIERGALHPFLTIPDYGKYADNEVRRWLGLKSWEENWGKTPVIVSRRVSVSEDVPSGS